VNYTVGRAVRVGKFVGREEFCIVHGRVWIRDRDFRSFLRVFVSETSKMLVIAREKRSYFYEVVAPSLDLVRKIPKRTIAFKAALLTKRYEGASMWPVNPTVVHFQLRNIHTLIFVPAASLFSDLYVSYGIIYRTLILDETRVAFTIVGERKNCIVRKRK
jgi:hypothetical protein